MVVTRINDFHSRNPRLPLVPPTFSTFAISKDCRQSIGQDAAYLMAQTFFSEASESWKKVRILSSRPRCYPPNQERRHFALIMGTRALVCVDADLQAVLVKTKGSPKAEVSLQFVILLLCFQN